MKDLQIQHARDPEPLAMRAFRARLLHWYQRNRRELPWRRDGDAYRVWLSEIMLQQTRVAAVLVHYQQFLTQFPTVEKLAKASPAAVLASWSGLGYYRRARSLHQAARQIVRERKGSFPNTAEQWRQLPGIGRYTAAAIASIVFGEPCAVVDGNVARVLERMFGTSPQDCWALAQKLLSRVHPGEFNQAMMELGATVCLPGQPRCDSCPAARWCKTCGLSKVTRPGKAAGRVKREVTYALLTRAGKIYLIQRSAEAALMPGMWELPGLHVAGLPCAQLLEGEHPLLLRHAITNTDYRVTVLSRTVSGKQNLTPANRRERGAWVSPARAGMLPLTGLARKVLRHFRII